MHPMNVRLKLLAVLCLLIPIGTTRAIDPASDSRKSVRAPVADMPAIGDRNFVEPKPGHVPDHAIAGWYLGVYGNYTPTGLVLTQVYPRTPAAWIGLEVGDRIVAVNGHQIGGVNGLRIDQALQRHASFSGRVRLLVQDRRTLQLVNVDVQLVRGRIHT